MELSELIESVDILDYISQYTDFTEKNGEYWALSPLKDENTPSFSVRKETNSFFDFSSGIGGNVLTFIRYYDKCSMAEAVEKLVPKLRKKGFQLVTVEELFYYKGIDAEGGKVYFSGK